MWSRRRTKRTDDAVVDLSSGLTLSSAVKALRQGDIIDVHRLPIAWDRGNAVACGDGVVVLSQTCDLIRTDRAEVQVAPVVRLEGDDVSQARSGRQPRYAPLPMLGLDYFADLSIVATIHKQYVVDKFRQHGVDQSSHIDIQNFSQAVGRRFDRYAFPNEVTPWIKPLQDIIRSRARKPPSPLSRPLQSIAELRFESVRGWTSDPPYDLNLLIILKPGELPDFDLDESALSNSSTTRSESVAEVAKRFPVPGSSATTIVAFWESFAQALVGQCRPPSNSPPEVKSAVRSFTAEVVSEDDFSYARVRRSAEIDLDHLSQPPPY